MPSFQVFHNATNTASATVPMLNLMATATSQIGIFEINAGSDATADNAVKYSIARTSARQTQSATVTPTAVDQNVTQAALTTCDTAWNINPTITASSRSSSGASISAARIAGWRTTTRSFCGRRPAPARAWRC
jgi:hypothetical protein